MGGNWARERRRDHYYRKAKREGYRSRASYKLMQLNERFRLFNAGDTVVELGASPGGWTQVLVEITGPGGMVVAVDMAPMRDIEGATFIKGDMTEPATLEAIRAALEGVGEANAVVSDMAPNISGNYTWDQARSVDLAERALETAVEILRPGGCFAAKVFAGIDLDRYLEMVGKWFMSVRVHRPAASRRASSEIYVIAKGFRRRRDPAAPV